MHFFENKILEYFFRQEVKKLEESHSTHQSIVFALKDQIEYFKNKSRETDRLHGEISKLKTSIKNMEQVQLALEGNRENAIQMINQETDAEALALLAATLKKYIFNLSETLSDIYFFVGLY